MNPDDPVCIHVAKPPLGIESRRLWIERRQHELAAAIRRYLNAGLTVPVEWVTQYNELRKELA